ISASCSGKSLRLMHHRFLGAAVESRPEPVHGAELDLALSVGGARAAPAGFGARPDLRRRKSPRNGPSHRRPQTRQCKAAPRATAPALRTTSPALADGRGRTADTP